MNTTLMKSPQATEEARNNNSANTFVIAVS
jgi:hypothetical protein